MWVWVIFYWYAFGFGLFAGLHNFAHSFSLQICSFLSDALALSTRHPFVHTEYLAANTCSPQIIAPIVYLLSQCVVEMTNGFSLKLSLSVCFFFFLFDEIVFDCWLAFFTCSSSRIDVHEERPENTLIVALGGLAKQFEFILVPVVARIAQILWDLHLVGFGFTVIARWSGGSKEEALAGITSVSDHFLEQAQSRDIWPFAQH